MVHSKGKHMASIYFVVLVVFLIGTGASVVASTITSCASVSNSSGTPTLVVSGSTIVLRDCSTALASWNATVAAMQIVLSPINSSTVLQNIYLEIAGATVLPRISCDRDDISKVDNITIVLRDVLPGGAAKVATMPPLSTTLVLIHAVNAVMSAVRVDLVNVSLAPFNGTGVSSILSIDSMSASQVNVAVCSLILPGGPLALLPAVAMSVLRLRGAQYVDHVNASFAQVTPCSETDTARRSDGKVDWNIGAALSIDTDGYIEHVAFAMRSSTLPQNLRGAIFLAGVDSDGTSNNEGLVSTVDAVWDSVTLLGVYPDAMVVTSLFLENVVVTFTGIRGNAQFSSINEFGSLFLFAPKVSIWGVGHAHNIYFEASDLVWPTVVYGPLFSVAWNAFVENITVSVHDVRSRFPNEAILQPYTLRTTRELLMLCRADVVLTNVTLMATKILLLNVFSTASEASLVQVATDLMSNVTVMMSDVVVTGYIEVSLILLSRISPRFIGLFARTARNTVKVNCTSRAANSDCAFLKVNAVIDDDSSTDHLPNAFVDVLQSSLQIQSLCPAGRNCSSAAGLLMFDGRLTDGNFRLLDTFILISTSVEDPMLLSNNIRSMFVVHFKGAIGRDLNRVVDPFSQVNITVDNVTANIAGPLGGLVKISGALSVNNANITVSRVTLIAQYLSTIFGAPLFVNAPNFMLVASSSQFKNGSIRVSDSSATVGGIAGVPPELMAISTIQTVATAVVFVSHLDRTMIDIVRTSLVANVGNGSLTRIAFLDALGISFIVGQVSFTLLMIAPDIGMSYDTVITVESSSISGSADVRSDALATTGVVAIAVAAIQIVNCTRCDILIHHVMVTIDRASVIIPSSIAASSKVERLTYAAAVFSQPIAAFASTTVTNPLFRLYGASLNMDAATIFLNVRVRVINTTVANNVLPAPAASSSDSPPQPFIALVVLPSLSAGCDIMVLDSRLNAVTPSSAPTATARVAILCGSSCQLAASNVTVQNNAGTFPAVVVTSRGSTVIGPTTIVTIIDSIVNCTTAASSSLRTPPCGLLTSLPNVLLPVAQHAVPLASTSSVTFPSNLTIAGALFVHRNRLIGFQALTTTIVQLSLSTAAYLQTSAQVDARTATLQLGCNVVDGVRFPSTAVSRQAMRAALGGFPPSAVVESAQHAAWDGLVCRWANWTATPEVVLPATTQLLAQRPFERAAGGAAWAALVTAPLFHGAGVGGGLASLQGAATVLRLQQRCAALTEREATGVDAPDDVAVGAALSENPLQLSIAALGPQAATAAGAVVGNLAIVAAAGGLSLALRTASRRLLAVPTGSGVTPLRSACRVLADIVPRSPASLVVPTLLLLQPLVALSVFLWASAGDAAATHPAARAVVGVLGAAHCAALAAAVSWKLLWSWRGADGGADTAFPLRTVPNRQFQARRSLETLRHRALVTLFTPSVLWVPSQATAPGRAVVRGWSRYALLFEGYRERCYWFLLVELAFGAAGGVVAGVMSYAASAASDDANAACSAAQSGGWVMAALLAAQLVAIACLRPYAVLMDAASNATILACSLVSEVISLVSASNSPAAEALLLAASVIEGLAILSTVLIDVVGYVRQHGSSLWGAGALCVARLKTVLASSMTCQAQKPSWTSRSIRDGVLPVGLGKWTIESEVPTILTMRHAALALADISERIPQRVRATLHEVNRHLRLQEDPIQEHRRVALNMLVVWACATASRSRHGSSSSRQDMKRGL